MPTPDDTTDRPVRTLSEGDLVDGESLGDFLSEDDAMTAPYEYFTVTGVTVETPGCVVVDFEGADSYGLPPDFVVRVVS